MKIGILGGSFDPIHVGHLNMATDLQRELGLDEVWFTPCTKSRYDKKLVSYEDRVWMLVTALNDHGNPTFRVSLAELEFRTDGRMYDLATNLSIRYSEHEFIFLVGSDTVPLLKTWYRGDELVDEYTFASLKRYAMCGEPISSTKIRNRIKEDGRIIDVTVGVKNIIKKRGLYV